MKSTGIIRRIDDLGRVVIPKEVRQKMRIVEGDALELCYENNMLCLVKYNPMPPFEEALKSVVEMLEAEDISRKISVEDKAVVNSIINMLLAKWKESEDTE